MLDVCASRQMMMRGRHKLVVIEANESAITVL